MPQPRFITSDSQMVAPGVYVKELAPAVPIRGQRRRVIGLAGQCLRGPVNKLVECSSYQRFIDVFGARDRNTNGGAVLGHVWAALQGYRWGKFHVVRVAAADAVAASFTIEKHVATLDLDPLCANADTVLTTTDLAGGATVTIQLTADGVGAGSLTRVGNAFTFHFASGVTTVANFETAVNALAGADALIDVLTPGTGASILAAGDVLVATPLAVLTDGSTTPVLRVDAAGVGQAGNDIATRVFTASDGNPLHFNFAVRLYGSIKTYENVDISVGQNNIALVLGNDDANLITLTKLADGRPMNSVASAAGADATGFTNLGTVVAGFTSVLGADGTIANTDYTGLNGPMEILNKTRGLHACAVVGRMNSDIKSKAMDLAAVAAQRAWFVCADSENVLYTTAITERAALNSGRLSYWFNHAFKTDPITRQVVAEEPFIVVLSIISQTDPDVHPGDFDNSVLTRAIRRVAFELSDQERDALDGGSAPTGGVSFLFHDQDQDGNDVIIPGNALTCDFTVNNRDLDGRYMKDFIIDALANRLRGDQFKGNTNANRADRASACSAFLNTLARSERYIMLSEDGVPQFQYVNNLTVNTQSDQAAGLQRELCIATLIPKNKQIQLNIAVGVDAVVSEQ